MTPDPPAVGTPPAGFTARPATMDDAAAVTDMLNASALADVGREEFTLDETRSEWSQPGYDLAASARVVLDANNAVAGYIEVWDNSTTPVNIWVFGRVHPEARRQGVGTYLMRWAINRARQAVPRVPPPTRVRLLCGAQSGHRSSEALFTSLGLEPVRYFHRMAIDLEEPPAAPAPPQGIVLRSVAEAPDLHALWRAVDASFAGHWGYVAEEPDEVIAHWRHLMETRPYDPGLWLVALHGDDVVGMSLCWPGIPEDPELGWVGQLGVIPGWRRRGLGLALLEASFGALWSRGFRRVGLAVDAASPTGATDLYERAGMAIVRRLVRYGLTLRAGTPPPSESVD